MTPERCARITGKTCFTAMMQPRRLTATTRSNASSVISVGGASPPAMLRADVVVQHVDAAEFLPRGADHGGEHALAGDIGLERDAAAMLARHRHGLLGRREVAVDRHHGRALLHEAQHRGAPIAHALAGDWPAPTTIAILSFRRMRWRAPLSFWPHATAQLVRAHKPETVSSTRVRPPSPAVVGDCATS